MKAPNPDASQNRLFRGDLLWRLLLGGLCLFGPLAAPGLAQSIEICALELKKPLWQTLAFLPPDNQSSNTPETRQVELAAADGQPRIIMRASFKDPLDPWPHSFQVEVFPHEGRPWRFEDARPFGAHCLRIGLEAAPSGEVAPDFGPDEEISFFTDLAGRLRAQRPLMSPVVWREMAAGLWLARPSLKMGVRVGSPELILLKFTPRVYQLTPVHESEFSPPVSRHIADWAGQLPNRLVLFTAGQYYPDRSYMGLLKKNHRYLSAKRHPKWQGYLASGTPEDKTGPGVMVVDGKYEDYRRQSVYPHLLQTFVLLDKLGHQRVVDSENLASRVVLAQDEQGFIIVAALTEGAITLSDLAFLLKASPLKIKTVLGLDGGFEAQLAFKDSAGLVALTGAYSQNKVLNRVLPAQGYKPALPAILTLEPLIKPVETSP